MYTTYVTDHSNQVHQLLVSVSRHFHAAGDGSIKYQKKPFEVNIKNYHKSKKNHLVYYILRDHFSGNFVFEITTTNSLISIADFLYYAWHKDTEDHFWGMPDSILVPKLISSPDFFEGLNRLGVEALNPPSGFASGIRIIRDIEDQIHFYIGRRVDSKIEGVKNIKREIYWYMLGFIEDKVKKWRDFLPAGHPRTVPYYPDFIKCFRHGGGEDGGMETATGKLHVISAPVVEFEEKSPKEMAHPGARVKFSKEKLNLAQEIICDAWETDSRKTRITLARKALKTSPYCADAYVLLAEESGDTKESLDFYEKGVQAGKMALGDLFFKENAGFFWGLLDTRPYMRALAGLADCLWKLGRKQQAISHYKELLRLNPNDNQGIRYILASCLLEEGLDEDFGKLLKDNKDDWSCFMLYSKALWLFRTCGEKDRKSGLALKEAAESNKLVPEYLTGKKKLPFRLPDYYSPGHENEAVIYASGALKAWQNTPGALEWLSRIINA